MTPIRATNFCPTCGVKAAPTDRFCGGCGQSLQPSGLPVEDLATRTSSREQTLHTTARASSSARTRRLSTILLGGWGTFGLRSDGGPAIWLARLGSFLPILPALYLLGWIGAFTFGDRATLEPTKAEGAAMLLVAATFLALVLALPLAGRSAATPNSSMEGARLKRGVALHLAALVLGLGYGLAYKDVSHLVTLARYDRARPSVSDEDAAMFERVRRANGGVIQR